MQVYIIQPDLFRGNIFLFLTEEFHAIFRELHESTARHFWLFAQTTRREKVGNDVIDIYTGENMENTPLRSRTQFSMNFTSGAFSGKTLASI